MNIQLIRHASLWIKYAGLTFLLDPMFSDRAANPSIPNSNNERRNPLVPLPSTMDTWTSPCAVLITHLHGDHWDDAAIQILSKSIPIFSQKGDKNAISASNFTNITEITSFTIFKNVTIIRTNGQHGTGEIRRKMGQVSGFILKAIGEPTLYIAGDTVWCEDVMIALDTYKPDMTIINAGGAKFTVGDVITMDEDNIIELIQYAPYTKIVAVHMDSINHCHVTRNKLRKKLNKKQLLDRVNIPEDGEWF